MIADPELDLYNRAVLYYAYLNYNGHLEDEALQARNEKAWGGGGRHPEGTREAALNETGAATERTLQ
ncbi:MAG: hypothetical protein IPN85_18995 [Flavobacteriales bacterium]|nr:hypothetical protein [Flavobacteriales bacterium]